MKALTRARALTPAQLATPLEALFKDYMKDNRSWSYKLRANDGLALPCTQVVKALTRAGVLSAAQLVTPLEAPRDTLLQLHTAEYLDELNSSNLKIVQASQLCLCFGLNPTRYCLDTRPQAQLPAGREPE